MEIEFRIKPEYENEWADFDLVMSESWAIELGDLLCNGNNTLGQYVGIILEGTKVFTGDFLCDSELRNPEKDTVIEVVFRKGGFMKKLPKAKDGVIKYTHFDESDENCYIVCGNIHDNPELDTK